MNENFHWAFRPNHRTILSDLYFIPAHHPKPQESIHPIETGTTSPRRQIPAESHAWRLQTTRDLEILIDMNAAASSSTRGLYRSLLREVRLAVSPHTYSAAHWTLVMPLLVRDGADRAL